jgi:hypothetical protein
VEALYLKNCSAKASEASGYVADRGIEDKADVNMVAS